jgi:hypothetical protein
MAFAEKRFVTLALILVFAFSFLQIPIGCSEDLSADVEDEALSIITEVIGLDMSKYEIERSNYNSRFHNGLFRENVDYTLEADGIKTQVLLTFHNSTLIQWSISTLEGSPIYAEPLAATPLDVAKDTLQRYQEYANVPIVQEARNVLDSVTEVKTSNVTVGDLKMQISEKNSSTNIDWVRTINGLEFGTGLSIRLKNGIIEVFTDRSRFFKIGSADVNLSQEEAVRIALEEAKTFTSVKIWRGDHDEVFPFNVKEEPMIVSLRVGTSNFTMYPYWYVWFAADPQVYSVTGVEVNMRADTGEISYSQQTSSYGVFDPDAASTSTPTPSALPNEQTKGDPDQPISTFVIAGAVTTAIAVAIATVALKKKSK